jgi:hypothetical protein
MKVEYENLYKFLISAGVALIALAILSFWLFLTSSFDFMIEVTKLTSLTTEAQAALQYRQWLASWFIYRPWLITVLLLPGITLCCFGIKSWIKKQQIADEIEMLDAKKKLASLSNEEISKKAADELKSIPQTKLQTDTRPTSEEPAMEEVQRYLEMKRVVIDKVKGCLQSSYTAQVDFKIQDIPFDSAFWPFSRQQSALVLEVKYLPETISYTHLQTTVRTSVLTAQIYEASMMYNAKLVIVFVTPQNLIDTYLQQKEHLLSSLDPSRQSEVLIAFVAQEQITQTTCEEIQTWFPSSNMLQWLRRIPLPSIGPLVSQ